MTNTKRFIFIGLAALSLLSAAVVLARRESHASGNTTLVDIVLQATEAFKDVNAARVAGYNVLLFGCVSGPDGAMGVHLVNPDLLGDGVDPQHPEALMYEVRNGEWRLVGVEYVAFAESWDKAHPGGEPPVLQGQVFHYAGSPNRYRIPAFYELHVWAWRHNSNGTFADWNPGVSCDGYAGEGI